LPRSRKAESKAFVVNSKDGLLVTADGDKQLAAEMEAKAKAKLQEEAGEIHEIDDPDPSGNKEKGGLRPPFFCPIIGVSESSFFGMSL
jgi:hypothetical protein